MSLMSLKKCKLSSVELQLAYNSLLRLKGSIAYEESESEVDEESESEAIECAPEGFEWQVDMMLSLLQSKLQGPQV
jgi:hypothetical protein